MRAARIVSTSSVGSSTVAKLWERLRANSEAASVSGVSMGRRSLSPDNVCELRKKRKAPGGQRFAFGRDPCPVIKRMMHALIDLMHGLGKTMDRRIDAHIARTQFWADHGSRHQKQRPRHC
jgi:hypothetical protein